VCAPDWVPDYRIVGFGFVGTCPTGSCVKLNEAGGRAFVITEADVKAALVEHGPLAIGMKVYDRFKGYAGGVLDGPDHKYPNGNSESFVGLHEMVLVGWDDGKGAWILRNSWGINWGETADYGSDRGYIYVSYALFAKDLLDVMWVKATNTSYPASSQLSRIVASAPTSKVPSIQAPVQPQAPSQLQAPTQTQTQQQQQQR
jgi:C1A family cysteine protease